MRVRLALLPPLTPLKILLPLPKSVKTISHLKKHLLESLSSVAQHVESWRGLKLEIEGFEVLGGSGIDVIEEGDVVTWVKIST